LNNKLDYKKTFILGLGFFAITITWSVYNAFMPLLLGNFIVSSAIIGFVMTLDNYLALFIQPAAGFYSDKINTRFGRRMPFIMVGMPLAAFFTFLIPMAGSMVTLIAALVFMNLSMSICRSPIIAMMPDITASEHRSKASSIINFMGGIGALIAYLIGGRLYDLNETYPFFLSAVLVVFSFSVLFAKIKEKRDVLHYHPAEEKYNLFQGLKITMTNKNTVFLLLAICSWFIAYNGVETFFTRYSTIHLGTTASAATTTLAFIPLSFLIFAIPSGIVGAKIGKRNTILLGVTTVVLVLFAASFLRPDTPNNLLILRGLFLAVGFAWAAININAYPLVADMSPLGLLGTFTGVYYLFSSIANIVSPPLLGFLIDRLGYDVLFLYGAFFFAVALIFMILVKDKRVELNGNEES
jgi:MFS family permease